MTVSNSMYAQIFLLIFIKFRSSICYVLFCTKLNDF